MTGETQKPGERAAEREDHELKSSELERVVGGEKARPGVGPTTATSTSL